MHKKCIITQAMILLGGLAMAEEGKNAAAVEPVNKANVHCPVMPDRESDKGISYTYQGKTFYFCCEDCLVDFKANPSAHLMSENRPSTVSSEGSTIDFSTFIYRNQSPLIGLVCSFIVILFGTVRWRARETPPTVVFALAGVPFTIGLIMQVYHEQRLRVAAEQEKMTLSLLEAFNYAVTHDYGYPPIPSKPELPPRLSGTYYRGNDERTSALSNAGNYRTCTFDIRLVDMAGNALSHGRKFTGEMRVEVLITRARYTADGFWSPKLMDTIFLTHRPEQIDTPHSVIGRVNLTTIEPRQKFIATYPIGIVKGKGQERMAGLVYVCEKMGNGKTTGARFHYAIQYDLQFDKGIVSDNSDLWMGSLYRTRSVPVWKLPLNEWFSHRPIPELTEPHKTIDPKALGLGDYQDKLGAQSQPKAD